MDPMNADGRVEDLIASPKARWALAWMASPHTGDPYPVDFHDAATARLRAIRLHDLRDNPEGLVAEVHNRVGDWRYQRSPHVEGGRVTAGTLAHTGIATLGPAEGYRRVAAALAKAPAAQWWWQPLRRDSQVWICAQPIRCGSGLPFVTSYGHRWDATAPAAALVTSTSMPRLPAMALLSDQNRPPALRTPPPSLSAWRVSVKPDAPIAEVHSPDDWTALVLRYPSHRTDRCLAPHLDAAWPDSSLTWTVDWRALSRDYVGVHLSVAGWLTATSRVLALPDGRGHTICEGWPTEATAWFRPAFTGEFERVQPEELDHDLEYGYGQPSVGSRHDLTAAPPLPWWLDLLPWR
jgi:hypothetical protein